MSSGAKIQAVCMGAGALCGLAWWLFIDGASYAARIGAPILWYYTLPGILVTFAAIIMIGIDWESLRGNVFGGPEVSQARFWFLVSVAIFTGSLVFAVVILVNKYSGPDNANVDSWPGVSILLQTILIYASSITFAAGRNMLSHY
ncbi:Transmembrane protein 50A [Plasmodiophora brassicae]|uniref:Transmembrane protein 50A n=1 Tax=Plasmodiophora brassicae TaxID=37360 RepID=A0A0G4J4U5_PLABS|nr:hypothetical protein PBRA_008988 [Plasmodiophora brassicae]SPQ95773.1 unnamed protein product [Plasmodiophora brassicae]